MAKTQTDPLTDPASERIVLAGLLQYGDKIFYDVTNLIGENHFSNVANRLIFCSIAKIVTDSKNARADITSILGLISQVDRNAIEKYQLNEYLSILGKENINPENVKFFTANVAKLGAKRELIARMEQGIRNVKDASLDLPLTTIVGMAEEPTTSFTASAMDEGKTIRLGDKAKDYIAYLKEEQPGFLGIRSGFPLWDKALGHGLRGPGYHLLGARMKVGKSMHSNNVGMNVAKDKIPVFYADTELTDRITLDRILAQLSGVKIDEIETGNFAKDKSKVKLVDAAGELLSALPFSYHNVSGKHHLDIISLMRRWVMKEVGFDAEGHINKCLIILDYIKMMDLNDAGKFQEYQYLGQMATDYHNFCIKYNLPMLIPVQVNRDGIEKEDTSIVAGSDRLLALCSSFSLLKNKTSDDIIADNATNGNKRITVPIARFGAGTCDGEYINIKADMAYARMTEGTNNIMVRGQAQL